MSKKDEIIKVVNSMIAACKPIKYEELNVILHENEKGALEKLEVQNDVIGIRLVDFSDKSKGYCTSTLALIATITDIAVGDRLAFDVDNNGIVKGVNWYKELEKTK